jgi:signal transduction histidine kinase
VKDDGRGMEGVPAKGIGLHSMRERAAELGGKCVIVTGRDGGTVVQAWLPFGWRRAYAADSHSDC